MKPRTTSATDVKEEHRLNVCSLSIQKEKTSSSVTRNSYETSVLDTLDLSYNYEALLFQNLFEQDATSVDVMDSLAMNCLTHLGTVFPILNFSGRCCQKDGHKKAAISRNEGSTVALMVATSDNVTSRNSSHSQSCNSLDPCISDVPIGTSAINDSGNVNDLLWSEEEAVSVCMSVDHEEADVSQQPLNDQTGNDLHSSTSIYLPQFNDDFHFDELVKMDFFRDFECGELNLMTEMEEECLMLCSIDKNVKAFGCCYEELEQESHLQLYRSCFCRSRYVNSCKEASGDDNAFQEADFLVPELLIGDDMQTPDFLLVDKELKRKKEVTLVLDLDETLVHSSLRPCEDANFTFHMDGHTFYVKQRPFVRTFLNRVAEIFEVVIFTASQSIYAERLLDILDPDKKFFSRRAYRESCIFSDGSYTKDLTILGVDLAKVAIIDNTPHVYRLQVENGIPIKSWFHDTSDDALITLIPFLETLVDAEDVRPIIAKQFHAEYSHSQR